MPELPTYTASGRLNPAPQQGPSIDAATRPYDALQGIGAQLGGLGSQLSLLASDRKAAMDQRQKEKELTWATSALTEFGRAAGDRFREDGKPENLRETEGVEFEQFAGNRISEISAGAPTKRAAEIFRLKASALAEDVRDRSMNRGESIRLQNARASNGKAALDLSRTYADFAAVTGPEIAASTVAPMLQFQLASIEERFGKTAPALATEMRVAVIEEMATATAATNPEFARQIVGSSGLTAETKLQLNNRIDQINGAAMSLERARFEREIATQLKTATISGDPVPDVPASRFEALYGKNWQVAKEAYDADRKNVNTALSEVAKLGSGANPIEQSRAASAAAKSDDPSKVLAAPTMRQLAAEAYKLAASDPVAWQEQNDPDIRDSMMTLSTLPEDAQAQFRSAIVQQRLARQGLPPPGDPHPERYLGHYRTYAISAAEADERKIRLNAATPDEKLRILESLELEFGDKEVAHKVYADMIELGKEQIPVTYRFAGIISDPETKKEFVNAQSDVESVKSLDDSKKSEYLDVMNVAGGAWEKFQAGWYGDSGEGRKDVSDAKSALVAYAQYLHTKHRMTTKDAMAAALDRVITKNYGFAEIGGRITPIQKARLSGGPDRSDAEIKDIERRLKVALREVPVRDIKLTDPQGAWLFPAIPQSVDMNKPEDAQILRDFITQNGFWEMDSTGEMVTLMYGDTGRDGFMIVDKNNQPLTVKLDDLPDFMSEQLGPTYIGPGVSTVRKPIQPSSTYPLTERSFLNRTGLAPSQIKTNWPVRPSWMGGDFRNFKLD